MQKRHLIALISGLAISVALAEGGESCTGTGTGTQTKMQQKKQLKQQKKTCDQSCTQDGSCSAETQTDSPSAE